MAKPLAALPSGSFDMNSSMFLTVDILRTVIAAARRTFHLSVL